MLATHEKGKIRIAVAVVIVGVVAALVVPAGAVFVGDLVQGPSAEAHDDLHDLVEPTASTVEVYASYDHDALEGQGAPEGASGDYASHMWTAVGEVAFVEEATEIAAISLEGSTAPFFLLDTVYLDVSNCDPVEPGDRIEFSFLPAPDEEVISPASVAHVN